MKYSITGKESGASDLGAIVPVAGEYLRPFGNSPNDVLTRHRAALEGVDTFPASRIMEAGNRFEDAIRLWFEDEFSVTVKVADKGYRSENCNLVASLDGIINDGIVITDYAGTTWEVPKCVIDFKCPTYAPDDPESPHYMLQLQGQMECTDMPFGILAQLDRCRCEWTISVFERHNGVIEAIRKAVDVFWDHMANDTNYEPVTSSEASRLIAGNRQPEPHDMTDGPTNGLDAEQHQDLIDAADTYVNAQRAAKASKAVMESAGLNIKAIMGGMEKVKLPAGITVGHTTTEYKATPEKIVPAKPARTGRRLSVKEAANG